MNLPDPAAYTLCAGAVIWVSRSFIQQVFDSRQRQKTKDELEQLELQSSQPAFISARDWKILASETDKVIKSAILELRAELAVDHTKRNEALKEWLDRSFMRAGIVEAKLETIQTKLEDLCGRLDRVENHQVGNHRG